MEEQGEVVMMIENTIFVKSSFVGYHRYKDAPEDVAFLRQWHRHVFYVEVNMPTAGSRALEFFEVQRQLSYFLKTNYEEKQFENSCEDIALAINKHMSKMFGLPFVQTSVSEDNENGAIVRCATLH